jgi:hypothetical protein
MRTIPCPEIAVVDVENSLRRKRGFVCPENFT